LTLLEARARLRAQRSVFFATLGEEIVAPKSKILTLVKAGSEQQFENLLRETSEYLKIQKPRLVKKVEPVRRTPAA